MYSKHVIRRIIILIAVLLSSTANKLSIIAAIRGVATLNVVAVPANKAKTANKSISLPINPSVYLPNKALQASEYFWRFLFLTWSINPKDTAKTK